MNEVTIFGAGAFGLACAWALIRRGVAVHVIEAAHIGAGASGGQVGALAPHDPVNWNVKKQIQLDALIGAEAYWAQVAAAGGLDPGYARLGRVMVASKEAEARIHGAAAHWPAPFRIEARQMTHPLAGPGAWLCDNLTARIAPRRAVAALAAAIRASGGRITEGAGPQHPDAHPARHTGQHRGQQPGPCIWATGAAGLEALGTDLARPVGRGIKGQSASLRLAAPQAAQLFLAGLHIVPHADDTVAIGSTTERDFADAQATDTALEALIETARNLCPPLRSAPVVARWAGLRPRATSRAPLLGPWPGRSGHWVANGGFKIGFAMAPWAGEALADWLLDGECRVPQEWRLG